MADSPPTIIVGEIEEVVRQLSQFIVMARVPGIFENI